MIRNLLRMWFWIILGVLGGAEGTATIIDYLRRIQNYYCPNCKHYVQYPENYCKNCGAKLKWNMGV